MCLPEGALVSTYTSTSPSVKAVRVLAAQWVNIARLIISTENAIEINSIQFGEIIHREYVRVLPASYLVENVVGEHWANTNDDHYVPAVTGILYSLSSGFNINWRAISDEDHAGWVFSKVVIQHIYALTDGQVGAGATSGWKQKHITNAVCEFIRRRHQPDSGCLRLNIRISAIDVHTHPVGRARIAESSVCQVVTDGLFPQQNTV